MVRIVATEDQAKLLSEASESVEIVDTHGNRLGFFAKPFSSEEIRIATFRLESKEPRLTTAEVLEHLRQMQANQ